jgi:hypothetical protein
LDSVGQTAFFLRDQKKISKIGKILSINLISSANWGKLPCYIAVLKHLDSSLGTPVFCGSMFGSHGTGCHDYGVLGCAAVEVFSTE